ncbi:MAG: hypothetical protein V3T86_05765 [Planctomycetota bacterium]
MSSRLLLIAGLATAGLLLWWLLPSDGAGGRAASRGQGTDPPLSPRPAEKGDRAPVSGSDRVERSPQPRSAMETHGDPEALGPVVQLRGRVVFDDGTPASDAALMISSSPLPSAPDELFPHPRIEGVAVSRADGAFEIPVARGGHWKLLVRLGKDLVFMSDEPPAGDFLEIVLAREPTTLELEFVDATTGEQVAPHFVCLSLGGGNIVRHRGERTGHIRWSPAPAGRFPIVATFRTHEALDEWVHIKPGKTTRKRFELHLGQTVRGVVLDDETGVAVRGAWVHVRPRTVRAVTDWQGRFELTRVPWDPNTRRDLTVVANGYARATRSVGAVDEDGSIEELQIRLKRPATLTARCVDARGKPLAHVVVRAQSFPIVDPMTLDVDTATAVTRRDGRVEFTLAPGGEEVRVACWWRGVRALEATVAPLRPSERRDLGDLILRAAGTVRGVVRTAEGEPAAGAIVVVEPQRDEDPNHIALSNALLVPVRSARCDRQGRFAVTGLQPGLWDLLVHGGGLPRLLHIGIEVRQGSDSAPLDLRLPEAVALVGRVVNAMGSPVPSARVAFQRLHPISSTLMESVETDADGRFSIPAFTRADEDVRLRISQGESAVERKVTPRDGPVVIVLE